MATALKSLSEYDPNKVASGAGMRFGIIVSDYNNDITYELLRGCVEALQKHGVADEGIMVHHVPGAYEMPMGAQMQAEAIEADAFICLGCVIKGETQHDEYINHAVGQGLMALQRRYNKPFIFGLLTPNTHQQAKDRAGGQHGNKGVEAAVTAIQMVALQKDIRNSRRNKNIGFKP